ncbi:hypothetical protein ACFYOV_32865 [Streptomyces sp. NPDC005931]
MGKHSAPRPSRISQMAKGLKIAADGHRIYDLLRILVDWVSSLM